MPAIVDFDQILADFVKDKPLNRKLQRPVKGEEISDERYAEALRNWEEYWKIEHLTNEEHGQLLALAGVSKEYYIAKHSVENATTFVGTLEVNGHSTVIGDSAFYRHSDIDW
jgi:hypothetical protein